MKIFLVEWAEYPEIIQKSKEERPRILTSFFYANETTIELLPYYTDFLLDSGAYTFMSGAKKKVEWEEYVDRYAEFINQNQIKHFFELDIDSVVGYSKVRELRRRLENATGQNPIPVWHKSRGIHEFQQMCHDYKYVAIGGIVSKEILPSHYKALPALISEAHRHGAKIHGLGFTNHKWLPVCHFDSVDSASWIGGARFGQVQLFKGNTMKSVPKPQGKRLANGRSATLINFTEWIKYQRWAEVNL